MLKQRIEIWNISQRYEGLLKLQRDVADAQKAYFDAEGDRLKAEAEALSTDEGQPVEGWLQAQKLESQAKLHVVQKRVLLLQAVQELRQIQLEDLKGHIKPEVVWQDERPKAKQQSPQSPQSPSLKSEPEAEASTIPGLLRALESLYQRERELTGPTDLGERLAASENDLAQVMKQTSHAERLAERICMQHQLLESQAIAADLLQAALEVQDEGNETVPGGNSAVAAGAEAEPAIGRERCERPRPSLLSLVMEEVGLASEQLVALSPWRSEASAGEETPSTRVHSLSEMDLPQSQVRQWRSPAEESTVSTSPSRRISPVACDTNTDGIDFALTKFLSPRRNRLRRSLFCREGHGLYRYGTCRLRLRFAKGELEASGHEVEVWEPLEEFLRKVEVDQSQRLRRARERAKALR